MEDTLEMYGLTVEDASEMEEDYHEYVQTFTDNRLYRKAVGELKQEIFDRFCNSDINEAQVAYHEMQGLKKIMAKLKSFESEYHKVQAIKEADSDRY